MLCCDGSCANKDVTMDLWHIRKDRIRDEDIRDKVGVISVEDKMWKVRLRWFRHMKRRCMDALIQRCEKWLWMVSGEVDENLRTMGVR